MSIFSRGLWKVLTMIILFLFRTISLKDWKIVLRTVSNLVTSSLTSEAKRIEALQKLKDKFNTITIKYSTATLNLLIELAYNYIKNQRKKEIK